MICVCEGSSVWTQSESDTEVMFCVFSLCWVSLVCSYPARYPQFPTVSPVKLPLIRHIKRLHYLLYFRKETVPTMQFSFICVSSVLLFFDKRFGRVDKHMSPSVIIVLVLCSPAHHSKPITYLQLMFR